MQADGKMLLGGPFLFIGPTARTRVARLDVDGNLDPTFGDPSVNSEVKAIAVQPDGKILIGGGFDHVGGQPRHYLARLNDDGTTPASRIPRSMARSGRSRSSRTVAFSLAAISPTSARPRTTTLRASRRAARTMRRSAIRNCAVCPYAQSHCNPMAMS